MKPLQGFLGVALLGLVFCNSTEDIPEEDAKKTKRFEGPVIDKDEFKKNFKDRLGPPWTNFNMTDLDFYILPFLNYSSSGLEPHFTTDQVRFHHNGILDQHRRELNEALKEWKKAYPDSRLAKESIVAMLEEIDGVPEIVYERIRRSAAAYTNHAIYFGILSGNLEEDLRFPDGDLRYDIETNFRSIENFKALFNKAASKLKESGNVFLVRRGEGMVKIETYPDNFTPLMTDGYPLIVLDMWEHAYYLKHQHRRSEYLDDWWMLLDWDQVGKLDQFWKEYDVVKQEKRKQARLAREARKQNEEARQQEEKEEL